MQHTMRSAFKRWTVLHNEERKPGLRLRIPHWFRHYIRQSREWDFIVSRYSYYKLFNSVETLPTSVSPYNMDKHTRRMRHKGRYNFEISDEELLNLQRPEWNPKNVYLEGEKE